MNTLVLRIDLATVSDIGAAIIQVCDQQLVNGFKLASTFVWNTSLILIFQKV